MRRFVALVSLSVAAVYAQVVPGRYVVELSGEPAAVTTAKQGPRSAMRESEFAVRRAGVRQTQAAARRAIAEHGGTVLDSMDTVTNALIVTIPESRAAELSTIPGVVKVHAVRRVKPLLNHALPIHKVPDALSMLPLGQDSAGAGIKIAMIDTGVDVRNPGFSGPLPPLDGFPKVLANSDKLFTNSKIIVAKNYTPLLPDGGEPDADDLDGHGTGTAMVAAGGPVSSPYGPLTGVAPKAYIGNYKALDVNGGTNDVVAKAIDDAVADGMDVINLSLGGYVASYSDIDPTDIGIAAIEAATRAGVIVTVAAGNAGPGAGTTSDFGSAPDAIAVGAIMNDRALGYSITIDGVAPFAAFPGDGPDPGQAITGPLYDVTRIDRTGLACSSLPSRSVTGMIVLVLRGTCTFESKINNVAAGGAIAAIIYDNSSTDVFMLGNTSVGFAALPALFTNIKEGTDLKAHAGAFVTLDFVGTTLFPARTDLVDFSSRGPSIGSAMKPDLVAVGEEIVTAAQVSYPNGQSYDPSGFIDTGGTSFSAPLAAGAAAVLKAARPGLTVAQYRSLLINGATPATSGPDVPATVQQAGGGVLNLLAGLSGTVTAYPTSLNFGTGPGSINNTLDLQLSNIGTSSDTYTITALPSGNSPAPALPVNTVQLDPNNAQTVSVAVNASNLSPGEYQGYLQVSASSGATVANIPYWFAVPGSAPFGISVLYSDAFDPIRISSTQAVVIRIVDVAGLPYSGSLKPSISLVTSGGGSLRRFYPTGNIPGTYAADIQTGTSSMVLNVSIAGLTDSVVIPVY